MCNNAVNEKPWVLKYVPDRVKTVETCEYALFDDLMVIRFVPGWIISNITEGVLEDIEDLREDIGEEEVREVERIIWKKMHKNKFYNQLSTDLFQYHHKKVF